MHRLALLVVIACFCLGACAFNPKVEVRNATNWALDVEVALPRRSSGSNAGPTQFRTSIPPGGAWSTAGAQPGDRATLPLRKANNVSLLRVKAIGSQTPGYIVYELGFALQAIVTVREDNGGTFDTVVELDDAPIGPAAKPSVEYFE